MNETFLRVSLKKIVFYALHLQATADKIHYYLYLDMSSFHQNQWCSQNISEKYIKGINMKCKFMIFLCIIISPSFCI